MSATKATDIDTQKMYSVYDKWPEHFLEASKIAVKTDHDPGHYDLVVFCGMGGSATSSDILHDLMNSYSDTISKVVRGSTLPESTGKRSLVVVNSVSGNTIETVSAMQEAVKRGSEVICISSGGKLKELAEANGQKHVMIPNLSLPRASLPYMVMPGLRIIDPFLENSMNRSLKDLYSHLLKIKRNISTRTSERTNISKQVASFIRNGFAFCFTSPYLLSAATRFKNSLNENAKVHCLRESVLEASHNEIVPFTYPYEGLAPKVVLLEWANDNVLTKERFSKVKSFFAKIDQPLIEVNATEKDLITALISSIYILDYATIYMAISRKIDPSPTPAIDILKGLS